jgi:[protein-PII] uridylyltransferase
VRDTFKPLVDSRTPFGSNYTELTVVAYDDPTPGLLAKIAAVLYAHDVNLHSAQVFTRTSSDRIAIDTLWVDYRDKPLTPVKRRELEETFRQVLTGAVSVSTLLTRKGKPTETVQPVRSLLLDDATSPNYSILDVQAPDTRGVVYRLADAISSLGWNIHSARLSTWRGNARNAYYLTDIAGNKIPADAVSLLDDRLPRDEGQGTRGSLLRARTNNAAGARK